MQPDHRYETAVNAAIRAVELSGHPPGDARAWLIGRITYLLLEALHEAERRLGGPGA